ncbi:MAG: phosphatase PAP2 family protein [SAR202 cluster bacterium]|nr:phosphatase PAP2 family protein [SAR202 cluster bacterium]
MTRDVASTLQKLNQIKIKSSSSLKVAMELLLLSVVYASYTLGRGQVYENQLLPAHDNALDIIELERAMGLLTEGLLQDWFLNNLSSAVHFFNWFYILGYWPVVLPIAVYLYMKNREAYYVYRTVALITLGVALVSYELYPLAPPRLVSSLGIVDTMWNYGLDEYHLTAETLLYNPYAAMPSLHFALAFVVSLYFLRGGGGPILKLVMVCYLVLMLMSIVVTGNHYIVDALGSLGAVGVAFLVRSFSKPLFCRAKRDFGAWLQEGSRNMVRPQ